MPAHKHPAQHTLGHAHCPACEESLRLATLAGRSAGLSFAAAAKLWLGSRNHLSEGSRETYRQHLRPLARFFRGMKLEAIHIGHVCQYQCARQAEVRKFRAIAAADYQASDGASRINHEVNMLAQVLQPAGLWAEIKKFYRPLPLPAEGPGLALTAEEEKYFFQVAGSRPRWMVAYCCDLISCNTTAGPGEIRHLRVRDYQLERRVITVREGTKNKHERVRALPLNADAEWAARYLLDRYREKMRKAGLVPDPDHYVLFHRANRRGAKPDPERPMGSWKKAHYAMRKVVAKKFPRLATFRRYDFRHTFCTKMLEDPTVSYSTIEKLMGHKLGSKTKRIYDHTRDRALRAATDSLNMGHTSFARGARPMRTAKAAGKKQVASGR